VQKGALADGTGAVENEGRFLGQAASQHGRELARSYAGERSVHDLQTTAFRICRENFPYLAGSEFRICRLWIPHLAGAGES